MGNNWKNRKIPSQEIKHYYQFERIHQRYFHETKDIPGWIWLLITRDMQAHKCPSFLRIEFKEFLYRVSE